MLQSTGSQRVGYDLTIEQPSKHLISCHFGFSIPWSWEENGAVMLTKITGPDCQDELVCLLRNGAESHTTGTQDISSASITSDYSNQSIAATTAE